MKGADHKGWPTAPHLTWIEKANVILVTSAVCQLFVLLTFAYKAKGQKCGLGI